MTRFPSGRPLTILRGEATGRDGYGMDTVTPEDEVTVSGCAWWPATASETEQPQDTTVTRYLATLPAGTDIRASDHVRLDGDLLFPGAVWRVDGDPRQHVSPFTGTVGGVTVSLEKVAG